MTGALVTTVMGLTGLGGGFWGWGRQRLRRLPLDRLLAGRRHLPHLLPDPTQQNPERSPHERHAASRGAGGNAAPAGTPDHLPTARHLGLRRDLRLRGPPYAPRRPPVPPRPPAAFPGGDHYGGGYGGDLRTAAATAAATTAAATGRPRARPPAQGPPLRTGRPRRGHHRRTALLVGGGLKALDAANVINLGDSGNAIVWASGAAVLGLGILIAGLRGQDVGDPRLLRRSGPGHRRHIQRGANGDRVRFTGSRLDARQHRTGPERL